MYTHLNESGIFTGTIVILEEVLYIFAGG